MKGQITLISSFSDLLYLAGRQNDRERERYTEELLPLLVYSRNSCAPSTQPSALQGPKYLGHLTHFPKCISKDVTQAE